MPSKTEGLGTSIIDAFNAEVPVVSTNAGGISELVENKKTGLSAAPYEHSKLAEHILNLINSNELKQNLVSNAKAKAESFHYRKMVEKTFHIYKSLINA